MGERIGMSRKERDRLVELDAVRRGQRSLAAAARRLGLSYRQAKRVWRRFQEQEAAGLVHGLRGRASNRRKEPEIRQACLDFYVERLEGFGPTLAAEKLGERGLDVDHETLRRWLVASGLWCSQPRVLRPRLWRPRRERFGELVQLDGSFHDWFGAGEGHRDCLLVLIDDATGRRLSQLVAEETTSDAMSLLARWIERYGVPCSLYVDRKSVYVTERDATLEEELAGEPPLTVFGKACRKLGIEIVVAHSPQAKGRVERSHAVYQDRLVKEIRLRGLTSREQVNELLVCFDEDLNRRFAISPADPETAHRPMPADLDLATVWVWEEVRTVRNDWTLSYENRCLQLLGSSSHLPKAKSRVTVQKRQDGSLHVLYRGKFLRFEEIPHRPQRPAPTPSLAQAAPRLSPRPAADHPWRQRLLAPRRGACPPPPPTA